MFNNLPESTNFRENNKKKLIVLSVISILWLFSFSTSIVANTIFYNAKLEEKQLLPNIVEQSEDVIRGNAITKIVPSYPSMARESRALGDVQISIVIDEKGKVIEAKVVSGDRLLRRTSLEAAKRWKFNPTFLNGTPIKVQGILTFRFVKPKVR